jgi:hypothetical protein
MSKNIILVLMYHRHKLLDLIYSRNSLRDMEPDGFLPNEILDHFRFYIECNSEFVGKSI